MRRCPAAPCGPERRPLPTGAGILAGGCGVSRQHEPAQAGPRGRASGCREEPGAPPSSCVGGAGPPGGGFASPEPSSSPTPPPSATPAHGRGLTADLPFSLRPAALDPAGWARDPARPVTGTCPPSPSGWRSAGHRPVSRRGARASEGAPGPPGGMCTRPRSAPSHMATPPSRTGAWPLLAARPSGPTGQASAGWVGPADSETVSRSGRCVGGTPVILESPSLRTLFLSAPRQLRECPSVPALGATRNRGRWLPGPEPPLLGRARPGQAGFWAGPRALAGAGPARHRPALARISNSLPVMRGCPSWDFL